MRPKRKPARERFVHCDRAECGARLFGEDFKAGETTCRDCRARELRHRRWGDDPQSPPSRRVG
jgi:hypothetical protein